MVRAFLALLVSGVCALTACAASSPPPPKPMPPATTPAPPSPALAKFLEVARKMGLTFEAPPGYTEVAVRENEDQVYHYAVASADGRTELRYTLLPFDLMPQEIRNKRGALMFFMTGMGNIVGADGKDGSFADNPVSPQYFNADDAVLLTMHWSRQTSRPEAFGYGYDRGGAVFIHRKDVGVAYIFALFKPHERGSLPDGALRSLRFAGP